MQVLMNYKLVVIVVYGQQPSASTQNMHGASLLCNILNDNCKSKVMLLGLHPSALPRQTMQAESVDFVCQGEGPQTIIGLLKSGLNKDYFHKIPGLWYREDGEIKYTPQAKLVSLLTSPKSLDTELPGMAWDLLPMDKYRTSNWHSMTNNNDRTPFASLYTSLGCPFKCSFCCINAPFGNNNIENSNRGTSFRYWNPDFIIGEFDKISQMGIKNVKIADEMFVYNKKHLLF